MSNEDSPTSHRSNSKIPVNQAQLTTWQGWGGRFPYVFMNPLQKLEKFKGGGEFQVQICNKKHY